MTLTNYTLKLYDADGTTYIEDLPISKGVAWENEVSYPGAMTFEVPLTDATTADLTDRRFVRAVEGGVVKKACRIQSETVEQAVDGRAWLRFENQPGAQCILDDAVVEPEYGLTRISGPDRLFGPMSAEGSWYDSSDWDAPVGVDYTADVSINPKRKHQDHLLNRYNPQWIAPSPGPAEAADPGAVAWFRSSITIADGEGGDYAVMMAGDDYWTVYCDGQTVFESDRTVLYAWRTVQTETVTLTDGHHLFAASVENRAIGSGGNVVAFVFVLIKLNAQGDPTGDPILMSNETDWICTFNDVGWHRAQVLMRCIEEAQDRGDIPSITPGFTMAADTDSVDWADSLQQWSIPVGTASLSDVVATLTADEMDVWLNPANMHLNAYNRQGSDLTGTVALTTGPSTGANLISFQSTKTTARHTVAYTQLADASFITTSDTAGVSASGRIEVGIQLGSATSRTSAVTQAIRELAKSSKPVVAPTAQTSSLGAPVFGVDYNEGDTITAPNQRGTGTSKLRVTGGRHDRTGDTPQDWPEFVQDTSV